MERSFNQLITTFQTTISDWDFFCDFQKIKTNTFQIKVQLNILNSLLGESDINEKFLEIIRKYPNTKEVLPILLAVRDKFKLIYNSETNTEYDVSKLFSAKVLNKSEEENILQFFSKSGLKNIFENKSISDLNDYVFWIETWLDTNARKNRWWVLMELLVERYIKRFCDNNWFSYKSQATSKYMKETRNVIVESDKSERRFDFAVYNWKKVFLFETNFYSWWWSKLKAVAWEFSNLYVFLKKQRINLFRITDWWWRKTSQKPLEEAFYCMEWNIYNIRDLNNNILDVLIKQNY